MRKWVFVFFVSNFILLVYSISLLSREAFGMMGLTLVHSSFMALALVLLGFWVWKDGEEIEDLHTNIDRL